MKMHFGNTAVNRPSWNGLVNSVVLEPVVSMLNNRVEQFWLSQT